MHAIFIHSLGGNSDETFFPWVRAELQKSGYQTSAPELPSPDDPTREGWVEAVMKVYDPHQETIFVGRSLGGSLIPSVLEREGVKAKAAFSICAPFTDLGWKSMMRFFSSPQPDFAKAKASVNHYQHWYSDNDPYPSITDAKLYQKRLGGELRIFPGYQHFWNTEFPELVEAIQKTVAMKKTP